MKVIGVIAASIVALLFLKFIDLPFPDDLPIDRSSIDLAMNIGVFAGAVIAGLLLDNIYAPGFSSAEKFAEHKKGTRIGCVAGGLVGLPVGFVLGVMFGGTLGAGIGSLIGGPFIPYGIGLVTMVVVLIFSTITSLLGSIIGNFAESAMRG